MTSKDRMNRLQHVAVTASLRSVDATRHKCFVSYQVDDADEVESFLTTFGSNFIPRSVGITEEADFIDSSDEEYIKRRIREDYLTDSTVTILLLGACTWSRKFVDWEISSTLRADKSNKRSGLLVLPLPSRNGSAPLLARVKDNFDSTKPATSYALYKPYPTTNAVLRAQIEEAFGARSAKAAHVDNSRALRRQNISC